MAVDKRHCWTSAFVSYCRTQSLKSTCSGWLGVLPVKVRFFGFFCSFRRHFQTYPPCGAFSEKVQFRSVRFWSLVLFSKVSDLSVWCGASPSWATNTTRYLSVTVSNERPGFTTPVRAVHFCQFVFSQLQPVFYPELVRWEEERMRSLTRSTCTCTVLKNHNL